MRVKIKQNHFWAAIYKMVAIPMAAGSLYRLLWLLLRQDWAALIMNTSTVTLDALLHNPVRFRSLRV